MSHTPRPWTYNQGSGTVSAIEGPTRKVICRYVDPNNASLIAAAPELLEALKEVTDTLDAKNLVATFGIDVAPSDLRSLS